MSSEKKVKPKIFTVGHSTRPIDEFVALLKAYEIQTLADIRTVPRSRHNPQFNRENLSRDLPLQGINYIHFAGLGGLRHPRADSVNTAWQNASFRGFADYMQTPEFAGHLDSLIERATTERVALICAETVPWQCHRSLIADALFMRDFEIWHIMGMKSLKPHVLTPWAQINNGKIWYPAELLDI